ncbi:MAG: hypothetical protein QOK31_1553 [Solirubrobacteraceae bacterium]|jgi:hypothetical protein|nr:hypothetical protein [Solirubrobacteraceae bacterium]
MAPDPRHIARLFEIAAFERPLTEAERLAVGLGARLDHDHVVALWERAAFEQPLGERELYELEQDLRAA